MKHNNQLAIILFITLSALFVNNASAKDDITYTAIFNITDNNSKIYYEACASDSNGAEMHNCSHEQNYSVNNLTETATISSTTDYLEPGILPNVGTGLIYADPSCQNYNVKIGGNNHFEAHIPVSEVHDGYIFSADINLEYSNGQPLTVSFTNCSAT